MKRRCLQRFDKTLRETNCQAVGDPTSVDATDFHFKVTNRNVAVEESKVPSKRRLGIIGGRKLGRIDITIAYTAGQRDLPNPASVERRRAGFAKNFARSIRRGYGIASIVAITLAKQGRNPSMLGHIVGDFSGMPPLMKRLALVQFFSWSALFIMWINTTPIVAQHVFGTTNAASSQFQEAGNWVDTLFATYNGVAAVAALTLLPWLSARVGKGRTHIIGLLCGAAGYASFFFIRDQQLLLLSEVGIGIAWASILAMPYAILASSLPQRKLGIYMGLFNVFVVVPQLLVATVMGSIMKAFFPTEPIWTMAFASGTLVLAALAMLRVDAD